MFHIITAITMIGIAVALAYHGHMYLALALSVGYVAGFVSGEIAILNMFKLL